LFAAVALKDAALNPIDLAAVTLDDLEHLVLIACSIT
jgi:hypothetical protein